MTAMELRQMIRHLQNPSLGKELNSLRSDRRRIQQVQTALSESQFKDAFRHWRSCVMDLYETSIRYLFKTFPCGSLDAKVEDDMHANILSELLRSCLTHSVGQNSVYLPTVSIPRSMSLSILHLNELERFVNPRIEKLMSPLLSGMP